MKSSKISIKELESLVRKHNRLYFVEHKPEISDAEFDRLVEELRARKPGSKVLAEIGSDISGTFKKVRHSIPMLSLDKAYDEKTMQDWAEKFEGEVIASPKIDGCAVAIKYGSDGELLLAATRGSGAVGEDVTQNIKFIKNIPKKIKLKNVEVRGEVYMPLSVFKRYSSEFANPRNLAAGAIKQKDPAKTGEYSLSFWAYDLLGVGAKRETAEGLPYVGEGLCPLPDEGLCPLPDEGLCPLPDEASKRRLLKENHFPVVEWKLIGKDDIRKIFSQYFKRREEFDYEMDGVVYKVNLISEQERLGSTAHHPRYAIAYKFQGDSDVTVLKDVEWSVARTGVITPVGIVEPVELSGAFVSRVSLHNFGMMKKLGLSRGAKVMMMRRGGVIPNLESVVEKGKAEFIAPRKCPSCGSPVEVRDDFLYCTEPKKCVQTKVGELKHFVQTVEIDNFGDVLLEKLYTEGLVTDISEFYELSADDLLRLERMGDVLADKLIRNISARRELQLDVFLRALGIRELGKHSSRVLAQGFGTLERVRKVEKERLSSIHTIGDIIAGDIVGGLKAKSKLIDKLLRHVKVLPFEKKNVESGAFAGKSFLFTGALLAMPRDEAEKLVEEKGGKIASGVSKSLDYLVVGAGGGAGSKLDKAKKLAEQGGKVKILSESEFLKIAK